MAIWPKLRTPNAPVSDDVERVLRLPADVGILGTLNRALAELTNPNNFEQAGDLTPDEAAAIFAEMFHNMETRMTTPDET